MRRGRWRGVARCHGSTTSADSTRNTPSATRQSPTGSRSRSKWACHTGLSSRAWNSTDEATRATACCSGDRSCGLMPTSRSRSRVSRRISASRCSDGRLRHRRLHPHHRPLDGLGHAGGRALREQPVAQHPRGHAVVAVVDRDLVDQPGRLVVPLGVAGRHELVVDDDRVGGVGDGGVAGLHVERLELLDRVGALGHPDRRADHGVQVDEHAVAQQLVDRVLAHPVARCQPEQGRGLVGGVVVDVQVGPLRAALGRAR